MSTPTGRALILIPLLLIFLVGLFYLLRPPSPSDASNTSVSATDGPGEIIDVAIQDNVMNPEDVVIDEGDVVTLRLTSDSPVQFHLHGYDLYADVEPGEATDLTFEAAISGRFAVENHAVEPAVSLGQILVQPR